MREIGRPRMIREGIFGGLVAGAAFAAVEILAAAMTGLPPGAPWKFSASLVMGRTALAGVIHLGEFFLGALLHFGLAALFGLIFAALTYGLGRRRRNAYGLMMGLGALYGAALWLLNFQLIARFAYPWFLQTGALAELAIHVLGYGIPMAYWVVLRIRDWETPRVHRLRHEWQTADGSEERERLRAYLKRREQARVGYRPVEPGPGRESPPPPSA